MEASEQGPQEIRTHVHFNEVPLSELTPGWLRALFRLIEQPADKLEMDAYSTLTIDPLGKLIRFDSELRLKSLPNVLRMHGIVEGTQLRLEIRSGDFSYTSELMLPPHSLLSDALSPQTQLPNLRLGQTWTVPALSPLWPTDSPMELLQATVQEKEDISWNDEIQQAWAVIYQNDPGGMFTASSRPRGKLWVLEDGTVIKQEATIFDSVLRFVRLTNTEADRLAKKNKEETDKN